MVKKADSALCRTYLSEINSISVDESDFSPRNMWWFQIHGNTRFGHTLPTKQYMKIFQQILSGCMMPFCNIGFLVLGHKQKGVQLYWGITDDEELYEAFRSNCRASLPGLELSDIVDYSTLQVGKKFGGVTIGVPCQDESGEEKVAQSEEVVPLDRLCSGMLGTEFSLLFLAERQPEIVVNQAISKVDSLIMQNSSLLTSNRTNETGLQVTYNNTQAQQYQINLEKEQQQLYEGFRMGLWRVECIYAANTELVLARLKNSIISNLSGDSSGRYEQLRCIDFAGDAYFLSNMPIMLDTMDPRKCEHPLNEIWHDGMGEEFYCHLLQSYMSSRSMANYWCLPKKEFPGYYMDDYVEFDTVVRKQPEGRIIRIGKIIGPGRDAVTQIHNFYEISLEDITRHALIVGATGGGKTNTMKAILSELWRKNGVPFLVIESAKREYIELTQVEPMQEGIHEFSDINVFTLGNETADGIKYRINPFEVTSGVSLQTHIDYLLSTFNAAFEMYPPMPYILERAVYEVYEDKGWDLYTGTNKRGLREYPTLSQLYYKIDVVTDRLGYDGEVQSNVKAALKARINSLRIGGKGALLDVPMSIPIERLLTEPCVFELEDIGDDDTKAFIIGILLVQLYEYRKACGSNKSLMGVLVVEEAHRLLKNVAQGEGNSTRAKAVEFFCNMLAEIRSFGQGIIIADQIPTKLAADTVKNTNLKIVHRTVMEDDRTCIGAAMHMTEEQVEYLCSLERGCAAVFSEGDNRPKLVKLPLIKMNTYMPRKEMLNPIRKRIEVNFAQYYNAGEMNSLACRYCEERTCVYKNVLQSIDMNVYRVRAEGQKCTLKDIKTLVDIIQDKVSVYVQDGMEKCCIMGQVLKALGIPEENQVEILVEYLNAIFPWN